MSNSMLKPMLSLALAASILAPSAAFASIHVTPATNAFFGKQKMIRFNVRNQSGATVELRAGDQTMTVETGKTVEMKLAPGTQVVTTTKTEKREAGTVICEASSALADNTVVIN